MSRLETLPIGRLSLKDGVGTFVVGEKGAKIMNRTGEAANCPCFGDGVHGRGEPNRWKDTTLSDEGKERKG